MTSFECDCLCCIAVAGFSGVLNWEARLSLVL